MRILLVNKFHYGKGGAERAYFDTAHILAENGHEVAFFAMEHPENFETPWAKYFVSRVDYLREQSIFSKMKIGLRIVWNFEAAQKLDALIREFRPEVAHLHNTYHQLSPSILWTLKKHGVKIVMTLHDYKAVSPNYSLYVRGHMWLHTSGWRTIADRAIKNSLIKSVLCAVELWLHRLMGSYAKVDAYIAPSRFLIDMYKKLGFPYSIQHVLQPLAPFPDAPAEFGKGVYFLFAGRLSAEKGVRTLLEAFAALPERKLVVAGEGPEETKLREMYGHLGNISFRGHLSGEALAQTFREAKAFVIPSEWYENMPYSMLEALGYGKPVIGSNLGGIPERVTDGVNGFLFEAGNVESLKGAIERLEAAVVAQLGRKAWESIQDLRSDAYYATLEKLYSKLIASN